MTRLRTFFFWLLAPALWMLCALPVALAHVAAHLLMDRMRRRDRRDAGSAAQVRPTRTTWERALIQVDEYHALPESNETNNMYAARLL